MTLFVNCPGGIVPTNAAAESIGRGQIFRSRPSGISVFMAVLVFAASKAERRGCLHSCVEFNINVAGNASLRRRRRRSVDPRLLAFRKCRAVAVPFRQKPAEDQEWDPARIVATYDGSARPLCSPETSSGFSIFSNPQRRAATPQRGTGQALVPTMTHFRPETESSRPSR